MSAAPWLRRLDALFTTGITPGWLGCFGRVSIYRSRPRTARWAMGARCNKMTWGTGQEGKRRPTHNLMWIGLAIQRFGLACGNGLFVANRNEVNGEAGFLGTWKLGGTQLPRSLLVSVGVATVGHSEGSVWGHGPSPQQTSLIGRMAESPRFFVFCPMHRSAAARQDSSFSSSSRCAGSNPRPSLSANPCLFVNHISVRTLLHHPASSLYVLDPAW
jgi:hypothetical protein